jgi:hypothetical protein
MKRYPRDYYATESETRQKKWRRFDPQNARSQNGYVVKAKTLAVRQIAKLKLPTA